VNCSSQISLVGPLTGNLLPCPKNVSRHSAGTNSKGPQVRQRGICLLVVVSMTLSACTTQIGALEKASCSRNSAKTYTNCLVTTLEAIPVDKKSDLARELQSALLSIDIQTDNAVMGDAEAISKADSLVKEYIEKERNENGKKVALGILAVVAVGAGAYALSRSGGGGGYTPTTSYAPSSNYETPLMCYAAPNATRHCDIGKACGDSCIPAGNTCHLGRGSACNMNYRTYP
jgi:hypothetical protein